MLKSQRGCNIRYLKTFQVFICIEPKQLLCNFYGTRVPPGQAIRGSDSQLCPKPPPKPSKVPLARLAHSSCPQARVPSSSSSNLTDTSCVSPRLAAPPQEPRCVETPDSSWASGGILLFYISFLCIYAKLFYYYWMVNICLHQY